MIVGLAFALLVAVNAIDAVQTISAFNRGGFAELNPLGRWLLVSSAWSAAPSPSS
jgi:hypothetical protein